MGIRCIIILLLVGLLASGAYASTENEEVLRKSSCPFIVDLEDKKEATPLVEQQNVEHPKCCNREICFTNPFKTLAAASFIGGLTITILLVVVGH